jgi:Zn-dependent protease with chaperone function
MFKKNSQPFNPQRALTQCLGKPYHRWIKEDRYIRSTFEEWFERLPQRFQRFIYKEQVMFLKCSRMMAFSAPRITSPFMVLFPQAIQHMSATVNRGAFAILSHELAHLYLKHHDKKIIPLKAEVEADQLTCQMGHAKALAEILEDFAEGEEKRVRLTYITSYMAKHRIEPFDV